MAYKPLGGFKLTKKVFFSAWSIKMQQRSASSTDDVAERLRAESKGRL